MPDTRCNTTYKTILVAFDIQNLACFESLVASGNIIEFRQDVGARE